MSDTVIQVENLWKEYRLGVINHNSLTRDLQSCWARIRGKEDPNSLIGSSPFQPEDRFWALKDVSFEVKQGDILGIIGRNGAGKSTLLKILSQVTTPTKGEVRFKGRIASLLEVGTGFHPELTGRENIFLNGAILGMSKADIRKKLDEIISFAEVDKFIETPVKRYSSGMYVRLAFAVAAHLEPEILVVDEVLAVGDAAFQKKSLGKMQEVGSQGRTVLFVSHNMQAMVRLCSRVIWLGEGCVIGDGLSTSVVHSYLESSETVYKSAEMDLSNWSQRYGNGEAKIVSARLLNERDEVSSIFFRNGFMAVEFAINSESQQKLHFSAVVLSETGIKLLHLCHHDGNEFQSDVFTGRYIVRFDVPKLPLCAGNYKYVLAIHTERMIPLDVVTEVLPFVAEDAVVTPRPYRTVAEYGYCWSPNHWTITRTD